MPSVDEPALELLPGLAEARIDTLRSRWQQADQDHAELEDRLRATEVVEHAGGEVDLDGDPVSRVVGTAEMIEDAHVSAYPQVRSFGDDRHLVQRLTVANHGHAQRAARGLGGDHLQHVL